MPARMVPSLTPGEIADQGEKEVYVALRDQLPADWVVRYHYAYCVKDGLFVRDGEADFIVVAPHHGLMFLEVKQSHGFDCRGGIWYRKKRDGSEERADNPFNQASKNKFRIIQQILCRALGVTPNNFPGIYGHIVIFPFAKVEGQLPLSQDPQLLVSYREMGRLFERIQAAFKMWGGNTQGSRFSDAIAAKIVIALSDDTRLVAVNAATVDEDDTKLEHITRRQFETFRGILGNPRVRVEGKAGSGKTMIALWAAQAFATRGQRVLFLCFNRVLGQWLRLKYVKETSFTIRSFHALCREYAQQARIRFEPPSDDADDSQVFWAEHSPTILDQAITALGDSCRFDAIVIDEAQDFHQDWWLPVQLLLRDPSLGGLYLFSDPDQVGIYGQEQTYPADLKFKFELFENCRNTRKIAAYCAEVIGKPLPTSESAPEGIEPELSVNQSLLVRRAEVGSNIVSAWIKDGFEPSRIAILSPWKKGNTRSTLGHIRLGNGIRVDGELENVEALSQNRIVWGSTIKSFKGLEADCILLSDIPATEATGFSVTDMYVAASRAKHRLAIIPSDEVAGREIRNWLANI